MNGTVDFGWTGAAAITWAWPLAFVFFAVEIGVNLIMLLTKTTNVINADMWNIWGVALTGYMVYSTTNSYIWAFTAGAIQVIVMLKLGDMWSEEIHEMLGYPGVTTTHIEAFTAVLMAPVNKLMDYIPVFNHRWDAKALKKKIGIISEPVVMGFIIGLVLALAGRYSIGKALNLAVTTGAIMAIFPVMAKFFMDSLTPFGTTMSNFMKKRFKNREFVIGLDWPILGQSTELWVTMVILIPVSILYAAVLPGNTILPFAGVINYCLGVGGLLLTGGNLLRMVVLGIIYEPLFLYGGTFFANEFTALAKSTQAIAVPKGSTVSWSSIEAPDLRFLMAQGLFTNPNSVMLIQSVDAKMRGQVGAATSLARQLGMSIGSAFSSLVFYQVLAMMTPARNLAKTAPAALLAAQRVSFLVAANLFLLAAIMLRKKDGKWIQNQMN